MPLSYAQEFPQGCVKLKLFVNNPDGLFPEPQLRGDLASDITVQLVRRRMGPLGGHYAAILKQGLTKAPFSEEGLKELILKVDAGIAVPEKVGGDKANINSDTLGNQYAPHGRAISTVYPYVKYIREYYITASRDKYKGAGQPFKSNPLQGVRCPSHTPRRGSPSRCPVLHKSYFRQMQR